MEEFIGIVKLFAGSFAPVNWQFCDGRLMQISQNQALFAILGTTYGGDGVNTFALPDLRSRVALGTGQGQGLSNYVLGQMQGTENTTLLTSNLPAHTHTVIGSVKIPINDSNVSSDVPTDAYLGTPSQAIYSSSTNGFAANAVVQLTNSVAGSSAPVNNIQPVLALSYIICLNGYFPSRN